MEHLRYSVLDLLKDATTAKNDQHNPRLVPAASQVLEAMKADGLFWQDDAWVYEAMIQSMVQSGALRMRNPERALSRRASA